MSTNAAAILRIAEAIPETADNFHLVRELIASLKDLVTISAAKESQP